MNGDSGSVHLPDRFNTACIVQKKGRILKKCREYMLARNVERKSI
jgi:hypothetical protein